jgi:hypothetical protein
MKTILEAPPSAGPESNSTVAPTISRGNSTKGHNRRRSNRRAFDATMRVYGSTEGGKSFYEEAHTIDVSSYGALLELNVEARVGQNLMLINEATQRQQVCKIVNIRNLDTQSLVVAVEFPVPHAEFWQVFSSVRKVPPSKKQAKPRVNEAELVGCV